MDDETLDRLLSGDTDRLAPLPKRVVRLFISSTFTDMTLERNSLMERVYPRLKNYCRERYGLDFQVVDMRWGVRDEATDDHQTVNLCSREITNCQRMSLGPNFVALIGDKYGYRPLCSRIKSTEYRALRRCLIELDTNTDFLDTWYKEDLNAVPAEHLLQPISSILKNFTNKAEPELQSVDQRIWLAIQERLHELLLIGSARLVAQGRLGEEEQLMRYSISVTEKEVIEGCLDVNDAKEHCLVYVRSIVDLGSHLEKCLQDLASLITTPPPPSPPSPLQSQAVVATLSPVLSGGGGKRGASSASQDERRDSQTRRASLKIGSDSINLTTSHMQNAAERKIERTRKLIGRFIDLIAHDNVWKLDAGAQEALKRLKHTKLTSKLKSNGKNLTEFKVGWHEQEGISLKCEEHKHYLNDLTEHFYSKLTSMVRKAAKNEQQLKSGLVGEVLQHSHYANHVGKTFHGRTHELATIRDYILSNSRTNLLPMFVYGVGGSGKTSVLARSATLADDWLKQQQQQQLLLPDDNSGACNASNAPAWNRKPCIITRFCGTTPSSSSMVGVLASVCRQLQYNFYQFGPLNGASGNGNHEQRDEEEEPTGQARVASQQLPFKPISDDFVRMVFSFRQLLDNCRHRFHRQRQFVIILDSLEHLSSPAESSVEVKYSWLTSIGCLPPNVRLIVSCSSESSNKSWTRDFLHLKRHFLTSYFDLQTGGKTVSVKGETNAAAAAAPELTIRETVTKVDQQQSRAEERLHLLRLVTGPAIRFMRAKIKQQQQSAWNDQAGRTASRVRRWQLSPNFLDSLQQQQQQQQQQKNADAVQPAGGQRRVWILHVKPLGSDWARRVLRRWLTDAGRNLTQQQWSIVEKSFACCSRPIFVKLAFGEVINWKSYNMQSDTKGLTFGSFLLEGSKRQPLEMDEASRLERHLSELCSFANQSGQQQQPSLWHENEFRWHIIAMEQEWLNYIEFEERELARKQSKQQQQQQQGMSDANKDDPAEMIIRIGMDKNFMKSSSQGGANLSTSVSGGSSSICHLSSTIDEAICQLFARIEIQHGFILTKHSLSYLTAARNGICENELEDLLSLDDVVLDDVFQYHLPPVRRIPPLLWTRIRSDLPDYLSERDADGIVVNWHHGQFKDVTERRYLSDRQQLVYIHSMMADYFLGKWADKAKPFKCTRQQIQMAAEQLESAIQQSLRDSQTMGQRRASGSTRPAGRLSFGSASMARPGASISVHNRLRGSNQNDQRFQWMQAKADRRVPHQPLFYINQPKAGEQSASGKDDSPLASGDEVPASQQLKRYNLRKLTELPYHLIRAGRFADLANEVLFNYKWLFASLDALGIQNLLSDFDEASRRLSQTISRLNSAKSNESSAAAATATTTAAPTITAPAYAEYEDSSSGLNEELDLESLVEQLNLLSDTIRLSCSAIHGDTQMLAPQLIGRLLPVVKASVVNLEEPKKKMSYLAKLLEQCDRDGCFDNALLPLDHCLQSPEGLQSSSLEGHPFAVMAMAPTADRSHLLAVSSKFIMWDLATGEISRDIEPNIGGSIMMELKLGSNNEFAIAFTSDDLILVLDILTQNVIKFKRLHLDEPSGEQIRGLDLVDKFGATSFVVWTQFRWFMLRVVRTKELHSDSFATASQQLFIKLDYSIKLTEFSFLCEPSRVIQGLSIIDDADCGHLTMIETKPNADNDCRVQVFTVRARRNQLGWKFELWLQTIEARAFCLSKFQNQLAFVDHNSGGLYLTRRRRTCWSKAKLLHSNGRANKVLAMQWNPSSLAAEEPRKWLKRSDGKDIGALREFEIKIDAQDDDHHQSTEEINCLRAFQGANEEKEASSAGTCDALVMLHDTFASVFRLSVSGRDQSSARIHVLKFPKDVRSIAIEPNRCQMQALLVSGGGGGGDDGDYLALASNRKLLLYSLLQNQLVKTIEAHGARITKLIPIGDSQRENNNNNNKEKRSIATASIDRTVKIWNLSNLTKDSRELDKLDSPIESICVSTNQLSLAACLGRNECGLFDWRTMKLLARLKASDLAGSGEHDVRIVKCRFSSNERHLCFATLASIYLYTLNGVGSSVRKRASLETGANSILGRSSFKQNLPAPGLVTKVAFLQQDTRVLITLVCSQPVELSPPLQGVSKDSISISSGSSCNNDAEHAQTAASPVHLSRRLLLLCYSIPDGRMLYSIDYLTPLSISPKQATNKQAAGQKKSDQFDDEDRISSLTDGVRLPVLTRDQAHIVTVQSDTTSKAEPESSSSVERRKSSMINKLRPLLGVYSARDGQLTHTISLDQLELFNRPDRRRSSSTMSDGKQQLIATHAKSAAATGETLKQFSSHQPAARRSLLSLANDQFNRLKAVQYLERLSAVALLDDGRGSSYIVDVYTKQLVASSSWWAGKSSSDGRYGLSRVLTGLGGSLQPDRSLEPAALLQRTAAHPAAAAPIVASASGLQLLEMRHCSPIRSLITGDTLARVSSSLASSSGNSSGRPTIAAGSAPRSAPIQCGFSQPNDAYVYYCDSRLRRLLLVRLHDGQLIANYKLAAPVRSRLKCVSDGLVLVAGLEDGSMLSLAIVDAKNANRRRS